ncbi:hypothetical protein DYU11_25200 [Fibrisoma montanum]|uniref:Bacteriophage Mx8 p63 C-terminal domain-containing protein n=1 Tax=Fibrisoma montanum TaxID=2305895 RepID=A0A418M1A0_9BACT|nr:P63C domain-containing protein [Fibrisoma montanum]RIV19401.1 hypothetical protein DYU11_25200 [Fibrisoma montanum]
MADNENDPNEDEDINSSSDNNNQVNEQKNVELTEEQRRQRAIEVGKLFEDKEDLIKARAEREKKKREDIIELQSGVKFTIAEVERIVTVEPQPYCPLFPYDEPFYKELYRLYYPDRDYKEYPKPHYVGKLTKELIYNRFEKSVFIALDHLNPLIKGRCRARRLFQHLNGDGQADVVRFRDNTIEVAQPIPDGESYAFRKKMWEIHKVPYQLKIFENND